MSQDLITKILAVKGYCRQHLDSPPITFAFSRQHVGHRFTVLHGCVPASLSLDRLKFLRFGDQFLHRFVLLDDHLPGGNRSCNAYVPAMIAPDKRQAMVRLMPILKVPAAMFLFFNGHFPTSQPQIFPVLSSGRSAASLSSSVRYHSRRLQGSRRING